VYGSPTHYQFDKKAAFDCRFFVSEHSRFA